MLPIFDGLRDINFFSVLVRMLAAVFCSAVIGLDGNTATAGYDPALMNGIYLILTDAELKLTLLEVTAG